MSVGWAELFERAETVDVDVTTILTSLHQRRGDDE